MAARPWWGTPTWRGPTASIYPNIAQDEPGLKRLFKQFSFPGGIPSHVAPETPGSIHEGGELGYSLSHAFGAAFDNPDLIVACVVGDGEAETGPLATGWHSQQVPQPGAPTGRCCRSSTSTATRSPTRRSWPASAARSSRAAARLRLYPVLRRGATSREAMHQLMAATLDRVVAEIRRIQADARTKGVTAAAALADDRAEDAQGLDRPEGGRRPAGRRDLPARTRSRSPSRPSIPST